MCKDGPHKAPVVLWVEGLPLRVLHDAFFQRFTARISCGVVPFCKGFEAPLQPNPDGLEGLWNLAGLWQTITIMIFHTITMNDDKDCFLFPTPFFKGSFCQRTGSFCQRLSESFGSSRSSTFFQKFSRQPFSKLKRRWKNLVLPHLTSRRSGVAKRWQHPPVRPCLFWDLGKELIHRKAL